MSLSRHTGQTCHSCVDPALVVYDNFWAFLTERSALHDHNSGLMQELSRQLDFESVSYDLRATKNDFLSNQSIIHTPFQSSLQLSL